MTPKMRGALEALKKMKHHADEQADKLTRRIEDETVPALTDGFRAAHANVDAMHGVVDELNEFAAELKNSNGGDPLDNSAPRSSEVAQR
jgi:hypothetical protein